MGGPYSGFAVYKSVQAKAPPAEVWDTACVDNGWGGHERKPLKHCMGKKLSKYKCMNLAKKNPALCAPFGKQSAAGSGEPVILRGAYGSIVLPEAEQMTV